MTTAAAYEHNSLPARWRRTLCLIGKEARQIIRDPSSIAIGIVLPVALILLFGYGLSLDVTEVPVAVVLEDTSPSATELAASFQLSHYFDVRLMTSMARADQLMLGRKVDGIIRIRPDFSRTLSLGNAEVQVLVHGVDANHARIVQGYARGAIGQWLARRKAQGSKIAGGPVNVQSRMWFNEANESRYFLVPGLIVLIMTLIGALLTARQPCEGHIGAGDVAARIGQEFAEFVEGPFAALGLHRGREFEAAAFPALAADDAPKIWADPVGAALLDGMTSLALLGGRFALVDRGLGQPHRQRLFFRDRLFLPAFPALDRDGVAGLGRLLRREQGAGADIEREHDQAGAEDGAEDFVELEGIHRNSAPKAGRDGAERIPPGTWRRR